jgi:hypothetical protein
MANGRRIGVVGAGPAGTLAALEAARLGARVHLFDTNAHVARKVLVTGAGRCNISNVYTSADRYTCADPAFLETAFRLFGHSETMACLEALGILTYATPDGWCYPLSDSAATVVDMLQAMVDLSDIELHLKTKISDVRRADGGFVLHLGGPSHTMTVDRVIVATGGKAYPAMGSKGELFPVLERLGHGVMPVEPALAPIEGDVRHLHKLQGVRFDVGATLYDGQRVLGSTVGNLMFTQYGFSGPAAMDLSHLVSTWRGDPLTLSLDLLPYHREELLALVARLRDRPLPLATVLGAVLPAKVPPVILRLAGLSEGGVLAEVTDRDLERVMDRLSHLEATVNSTRGFRYAQLSTGGISVLEVEPRTMASRIVPGLYFAGEVMDVIGPCGGFNLQFAFTSGVLAGRGVALS